MTAKTLFLYVTIVGFFSGVFVASLYRISLLTIGICFVAASVAGVFSLFFRRPVFISCVIFALLCSLGMFRFFIFEHRHIPDPSFEGKKVAVEGMVVSLPKKENGKISFMLKTKEIRGNIKVTTSGIELRRGDKVAVQGSLAIPENFETDTGREFDYIRYLKKDNVLYQVSFATVRLTEHSWGLTGVFGLLHDSFLQKVNEALSYPESALIAGILLGAENDIPQDMNDDFRNVGLVHIVVLSGYNISIVTRCISIFSARFNRYLRTCVDLVFVFLFIFFVGATATVVRAGVMASLANVANLTYRKQSTFHILLVAAFFMVIQNPLILMFDPSFQLSCLATAGLVLLSKPYEHFFRKLPNIYKMRETVSTSLATQTLVLPLIIYFSGIISPVSLVANIIVLPLMPPVMLFGFLSGILGFVSSYIALPFGYATSLITSFILFVASYGASLPFAFFKIVGVSGYSIVISYALLSVGVYTLKKRLVIK